MAAASPATATSAIMLAQVRRLPLALVVGGTIAFLLIVAASAVVVTALIGGGESPTDPGGPTGGTSSQPGTLQVVDVRYIRAEVPQTWSIVRRDPDTVAVLEPVGNVLWLRSGTLGDALDLDALQALLLERAAEQAADAGLCGGPASAVVPGLSLPGRYFAVCSTRVPQGGGQAVRFAEAYYVAVDGTGTGVFVMQLTASPGLVDGFAATVRSLPPPTWKLAAD